MPSDRPCCAQLANRFIRAVDVLIAERRHQKLDAMRHRFAEVAGYEVALLVFEGRCARIAGELAAHALLHGESGPPLN